MTRRISGFCEVAPERLEGGRLELLLVVGHAGGAGGGGGAFFGAFAGELGIELAEDLVAGALDVDLERLEDAGGDALTLAEKAEQDVLGADVAVVEGLGLLASEGEDLLDARGVGNAAGGLALGAGSDLAFDR
jgi:hypothetical protein